MNIAETVTRCEIMPADAYSSLWDSIIVSQNIKERLLHSVILSLRLRKELAFETTALHGLSVLYGPPGTGKTTLARGLAHQLAPLMEKEQARLIEINPHGLMSAEHGQSQNKVSELLGEYIPSLADDQLATIVLLDEVESMAVARSEASLAANPADVHRATDAVLSALDTNAVELPHVHVVATSNFTSALDEAFLSRADIAIEIGLPDSNAIFEILRSSLSEMGKAFPALTELAQNQGLGDVATHLVGSDGRRVRKAIIEAMAIRLETVRDPNLLTIADLNNVAGSLRERDGCKSGIQEE